MGLKGGHVTQSGHARVASLIDELHLVAHPEGGY